jgi:hypothetical protein
MRQLAGGDGPRSHYKVTTASTYRQRQDIIQGAPCPNCGQIRWARAGNDCLQCQQCDSVFQTRTLWAEMSHLPITQPAEPEVHLEHPEFASFVAEYARLDQAERFALPESSPVFDRGQRIQQLEDVLPADVCAAVQVLNDQAAQVGATLSASMSFQPSSSL